MATPSFQQPNMGAIGGNVCAPTACGSPSLPAQINDSLIAHLVLPNIGGAEGSKGFLEKTIGGEFFNAKIVKGGMNNTIGTPIGGKEGILAAFSEAFKKGFEKPATSGTLADMHQENGATVSPMSVPMAANSNSDMSMSA